MAVCPGTRLGVYEIIDQIGEGGMGQVFRAHDTRLNRDVALKILPDAVASDPDRLARFTREAQTLASLNHPHIAQIHGLEESAGVRALVMELVEGEDLSQRIARGAIPLADALPTAKQIAEALEAAHEQGIVHRDLKPANVKVRPDGTVKVLDFGLAKALDPTSAASAYVTQSPTITTPAMTQAGLILGTAAYMSPEQAKGRTADKRSDIWAFGCVLYEMLTGQRAFAGEDVSDTLAAVLRGEPDWRALPPATPPAVRRLLRRCLERDLKQRLQAIAEARIAIDAPDDAVPIAETRLWPWAAALGLALCVAVVGWVGWLRSPPRDIRPFMRLSADLPPGTEIPGNIGLPLLALSPDGMRLAIMERDAAGTVRLATRRLEEDQFALLSGTEGARNPFFSPDGQSIAFFADGKLKKISVQGGSPVTLCDAPNPRGASWGDDGDIIAALNGGTAGLSRIPSGGGSPTRLAAQSVEKGERLSAPQVLPGSQAVLFTALVTGGSPDDAEIGVLSLRTGQQKIIQRNAFFARYLPSGHLVYMQQGTLYAAPFDLNTLAITGASQPVLEDIRLAGLAPIALFDFSRNGSFVYLGGKGERSAIFWLDSAGHTLPLQAAPVYYASPRFSPDGKRLAFAMGSPRQLDIWINDLDANRTSRLTRMSGSNHHPVWTPDGTSLVFESVLGESPSLYWIRADGASDAQRLTDDKIRRIPLSFSTDGKRLAFSQEGGGGQSEIWTAPVESGSDRVRLGKPELFLRNTLGGSSRFSPDGRWMAYSTDETGRLEVYVSPFPGPGRKWPISSGGGSRTIWSGNGRELFFLTPEDRIMVVSYTAKGNAFAADKPRLWSEKRLLRLPSIGHDLAPDGKRFAAILNADGTGEPIAPQLIVLLNFFDELRRRVPVSH